MNTGKQWHAKWWTEEKHGSAWERVKEALKRDWEQTKADVSAGGKDLNQNVGDTVKQAAGSEAIPPANQPNPPSASQRSTGGDWEHVEPAFQYGHGARQEFGAKHSAWNDELDRELSAEWQTQEKARNWDEIRPYVRRGYDAK